MEVKAKKSVRFDKLVSEAGEPVSVTLWTKAEDDKDFMRAVKEKRVVTVIQHNVGTKKDYGLVGFYPQERATYLLFPKRIEQLSETKIVGIKYERLAMAARRARFTNRQSRSCRAFRCGRSRRPRPGLEQRGPLRRRRRRQDKSRENPNRRSCSSFKARSS